MWQAQVTWQRSWARRSWARPRPRLGQQERRWGCSPPLDPATRRQTPRHVVGPSARPSPPTARSCASRAAASSAQARRCQRMAVDWNACPQARLATPLAWSMSFPACKCPSQLRVRSFRAGLPPRTLLRARHRHAQPTVGRQPFPSAGPSSGVRPASRAPRSLALLRPLRSATHRSRACSGGKPQPFVPCRGLTVLAWSWATRSGGDLP